MSLQEFKPWELLFDELKLEILNFLVLDKKFPAPLINFSITSKASYAFGTDHSIWQQALSRYFPLIVARFKNEYHDSPYALFQKTYLKCREKLNEMKCGIPNILYALGNGTVECEEEKKPVVFGLLLAMGHRVDEKNLTPLSYHFALKTAASFGFSNVVEQILNTKGLVIPPDVLRQTFILAAKNGCMDVVSFMHRQETVVLNTTILRQALKKAAGHNQLEIVDYFLKNAHDRLDPHSKHKALKKALVRGHVPMVEKMLGNCGDTVPAFEMRKMLETAASNGNTQNLGMLLAFAPVKINIRSILAALDCAVEHGNDAAVSYILERHLQIVSIEHREKILQQAAAKGLPGTLTFLLENDRVKFSVIQLGKAMFAATQNNHPQALRIIIESAGWHICPKDKKEILETPCFKASGLTIEHLFYKPRRQSEEGGEVKRLIQQFESLHLYKNHKNKQKENREFHRSASLPVFNNLRVSN